MGVRFQRRMRLFPGVRLNFSGGGISTTIGVRGASVNIGPRGSYLNLGLPGSGLSYRTRISPAQNGTHQGRRTSPALRPTAAFVPDVHEIRSADVSVLTSSGLGELKNLINEASAERKRIFREISIAKRKLLWSKVARFLASFLVIRLTTWWLIPRLARSVEANRSALDDALARLDGCGIDVDFAFDEDTLKAYEAVAASFQKLSECQRIWDVTGARATNRFVERTTAGYSVTRAPVGFDLADFDLIRTRHRALRFGNVTGLYIHIYPGFVLMKDRGADFALIEFAELTVRSSATHFIEEERVPSDSRVIGSTWKKANKDGSRDRRFKSNYEIPIACYGELAFESPTGLLEAYMVSNPIPSEAFARALSGYQKILATAASISSRVAPKQLSLAPIDEPQVDHGVDHEDGMSADRELAAARGTLPRWSFALDLLAIAVIIAGIAVAGSWNAPWTAPVHRVTSRIVAAVSARLRPPAIVMPASPSASPGAQAADAQSSQSGSRNATPEPPAQSPTPPTFPAMSPVAQAASPTVDGSRETVYVKSGANVRDGPFGTSKVVGTEPKGKALSVFGRQGSWTEVGGTAPIGWVYSGLLTSERP